MDVPKGLRLTVNWLALAFFLFYIGSLIAYITVRIHDSIKYMNMAMLGYSLCILAVELFGVFALLPYGLANVRHVRPKSQERPAETWAEYFSDCRAEDTEGWHVFILVPCYAENWKTIKRTLVHASEARVPPGCTKHVILCDDGHDQAPGKDEDSSPNIREGKLRELEANLHRLSRLVGAPARPLWAHRLHISQRDKQRRDAGSHRISKIPGNGKSLNVNHAIQYVIPHILANMDGLQETVVGDVLSPYTLPRPKEWHIRSLPAIPSTVDTSKCVVVILDVDMAINKDSNEYARWDEPPCYGDGVGFLPKVLRLLMQNPALDLVLTPQTFNNVAYYADVFNHINHQFWRYILAGLAALGYVACTGTNMAIRYNKLRDDKLKPIWARMEQNQNVRSAHYEETLQAPFPTTTVTEDYALSLWWKRLGFTGTYYEEGLVTGEMPEGIDSIDRQRGRWAEGHWQIFFSKDNPILGVRKLGLGQAILYSYGTLAYLCNILTVWVYTFVPLLSAFGLFPVYVTSQFRVVATLYLLSIFMVQNYIRDGEHLLGMWQAGMSNILLSWTFMKAIARSWKQDVQFAASVVAAGTAAARPAHPAPAPAPAGVAESAPVPEPIPAAPPAPTPVTSSSTRPASRLSATTLPDSAPLLRDSTSSNATSIASSSMHPNSLPPRHPAAAAGSSRSGARGTARVQASAVHCPSFNYNLQDVEAGHAGHAVYQPSAVLELNPPAGAKPDINWARTDKDKIVGHLVYFAILALCSFMAMIVAVSRMVNDRHVHAILLLPFLWAAYNLVGPVLFFIAAFAKKTATLSRATVVLALVHTQLGFMAVVTLWFVNSSLTIGSN